MEKQFAKGLIFKKPREGSPSFVKGSLSIKMNEFMEWADKNQKNGWLNIDLKEGKSGKYYAELNTFEPKQDNSKTIFTPPSELPEDNTPLEEIPF